MLHGSQDRIRSTVDRYLGHCSVTPDPLGQLHFLLTDLIRDPAWTPQEIEEVGQRVLTALNRAADSQSVRDYSRARNYFATADGPV